MNIVHIVYILNLHFLNQLINCKCIAFQLFMLFADYTFSLYMRNWTSNMFIYNTSNNNNHHKARTNNKSIFFFQTSWGRLELKPIRHQTKSLFWQHTPLSMAKSLVIFRSFKSLFTDSSMSILVYPTYINISITICASLLDLGVGHVAF